MDYNAIGANQFMDIQQSMGGTYWTELGCASDNNLCETTWTVVDDSYCFD
jgi:hypothetical protein